MHKEVDNYFSMKIDRKDSVVVIPRSYKGIPIIAYSPTFIIVTKESFERYRDKMLFDPNKTTIVFLPD